MKFLIPSLLSLAIFVLPCYGEIYKWVDEKGTIYYTDNFSNIPEKYRSEIEKRKTPSSKETPSADAPKMSTPLPKLKTTEPKGFEIDLLRRHELLMAEVILNGRLRQQFVVDTGASFTLIHHNAAKELGITIDENTPFIRAASVSDVILTPLVTLKSVRVGDAELENVEALIYNMVQYQGLLGNSFLNKFRVVLDSMNTKMTLFPLQGVVTPDRPGGYSRDYWVGQFRFHHRNLEELKKLKARYENEGNRSELNRVNNAIRYFENQLGELERKASFSGVPRNWRE